MSYKDEMTYIVVNTGDGSKRVELYREGYEVAALYYEIAKKGFVNKPVGYGWACVDVKYSDPNLYDKQEDLTPTLLLEWGQEIIHLSTSLTGIKQEEPQE